MKKTKTAAPKPITITETSTETIVPAVQTKPPTPLGEDVARLSIDNLAPHPMNALVYGKKDDDKFVEAVRVKGIYAPLLITKSPNASGIYRIISGHRRFEAARAVGIKDIPVIYFNSDDEDDILAALLEANRQRVKSHEQVGREYRLYLELESRKAARRQKTNVGGLGREKFSEAEKGKASDKAAEPFGLSGVTANHCLAVIEAIDVALEKQQNKKASKLREALQKSIHSAYSIVAPKKKKAKDGDAPDAAANPPQPEPTPDEAIKGVEVAVNFLRGQDSLTQDDKVAWKKVAEQLFGLLRDAGIEIEVAA